MSHIFNAEFAVVTNKQERVVYTLCGTQQTMRSVNYCRATVKFMVIHESKTLTNDSQDAFNLKYIITISMLWYFIRPQNRKYDHIGEGHILKIMNRD